MYGTCAENNNGRRIKRPLHISLLNSSQKASRYVTRRQINSADDSKAACKLQKLRTENLSLKMKLRNIELTQKNAKKQIEELKTVVKRLQEEQFSYSISLRSQIHLSICVDYLLNNSIFSGIVCSLTVMSSHIPIVKVLG